MEAIKEDCEVSGLCDIKWICRLLRCGRLEGKQVSKGGGADNKFMLVYLEIYSLGEKKIRDVASLPLQLDREKAVSLCFSLLPW